MTFYVHAVEQDLAHKWYARVVINDTESVFLKFDEFPSMAEIQAAAEQYVAANMPQMERARDDDGRFIADDPNTPKNEAWVEVTDGAAE